ncbi:glycoside hydrolase family 97 catalytic domain-containing protein [Haloferula sargassicola]
MSLLRALLIASVLSPHLHAAESYRLDELDLGDATTGFGWIQKNRAVSEKPLTIGGQKFEHGIGAHAPSEIGFRLDGGRASFRAMVGADDGADEQGSMVFQVLADGKVVFDSGVMKTGDRPKEVEADLTGAKSVLLKVTDAGDGRNYDHADWAEAVILTDGAEPAAGQWWKREVPVADGKMEARPALESPGGKRKCAVAESAGRLFVVIDGMEPMPLGITVDGLDYGAAARITGSEDYEIDGTYPWFGNVRQLTNHAAGRRFHCRTDGKSWTLDVRAYDDGIAWRYVIPGSGKRTVQGEATAFVLPEGAKYWSHHNTANYEANFEPFMATADTAGRPLAMPVTVELPKGGFACITEAQTMGYSGMSLGPEGKALCGIFEDDRDGWEMSGEIVSPWRVVILADSLTGLVNQSIVYNLCPAPDEKLFPEGRAAAWIQPGRAFWTWGFGLWDSAKWDKIMGFVDDAADLDCRYFTIDDPWRDPRSGWHRNGGDEWDSLKEVCDHAATKGVKIMVWEHWEKIRDEEARKEFFENVAKAGAAGVKLDFMDSESHERLEFYHSCLELAAKHHVLVNFHGANKPAGEERTWPNLMTREGIFGGEQRGSVERRHLAALPFTRLVTGPADYTPGALRADPLGNTTAGSQLAVSVALNSPICHWYESADTYHAQPPEVLQFIRTKPVVWDEYRVLPQSKIGEMAVVARRDGDDWWVAGINGTDEVRDYQLGLGFLAKGGWTSVVYQDQRGDQTKLEISKPDLQAGDSMPITMQPGGGFVVVLKRK